MDLSGLHGLGVLMFRGDEDDPGLELIVESLGRELKEASEPILGMEARSILKSIETETQKLNQFETLARTDRHYFRARFNYYKLSVLRLRNDERSHLEPKIGKFFDLIMEKELASDALPEVVHTPFLEAVKPLGPSIPPFRTPNPADLARAPAPANTAAPKSMDILSELHLVRLALQATPSAEGNRFVVEAIDRIISKLK